MIIDIHTHCFPDTIAAKAIGQLQQNCSYPCLLDGTAADLARSAQAAGIDLSVIQPIATKPAQTVTINRWAAQFQDGPLRSFGTLHPDTGNYRDEVRFLADTGIKGIKMHPEYQGFHVDDPRYFPLYDAVFSAGLAILFHAGGDIGLEPPYHCLPAQLSRLIDAFPGATIIAAHMGGYDYWDEVEQLLIGRDIYLDTSFSMPFLGLDRALRMIRRHGAGKILFGTDSPWQDQAADLALIDQLALLPDEKAAILGGNAARLLQITERE